MAVTVRAAFIVTTQVVLEVESQPIQLRKVDPPFGIAVSVTVAPTTKLALQILGQTIPEGELVTVPVPPVPPIVTVRIASPEQLGLPFNRMATSADARMAEPAGGLAGLLYAVAVTCPLPQILIAVTKPVCVTLTVPGTSVAQVTAW